MRAAAFSGQKQENVAFAFFFGSTLLEYCRCCFSFVSCFWLGFFFSIFARERVSCAFLRRNSGLSILLPQSRYLCMCVCASCLAQNSAFNSCKRRRRGISKDGGSFTGRPRLAIALKPDFRDYSSPFSSPSPF